MAFLLLAGHGTQPCSGTAGRRDSRCWGSPHPPSEGVRRPGAPGRRPAGAAGSGSRQVASRCGGTGRRARAAYGLPAPVPPASEPEVPVPRAARRTGHPATRLQRRRPWCPRRAPRRGHGTAACAAAACVAACVAAAHAPVGDRRLRRRRGRVRRGVAADRVRLPRPAGLGHGADRRPRRADGARRERRGTHHAAAGQRPARRPRSRLVVARRAGRRPLRGRRSRRHDPGVAALRRGGRAPTRPARPSATCSRGCVPGRVGGGRPSCSSWSCWRRCARRSSTGACCGEPWSATHCRAGCRSW